MLALGYPAVLYRTFILTNNLIWCTKELVFSIYSNFYGKGIRFSIVVIVPTSQEAPVKIDYLVAIVTHLF